MLGLANVNKCRPSTLLDVTDPYTAFCFDEACALITKHMEDGEEPQFKAKYTSFRDLYAKYK